jgi:hypothetical protein
MMEQMWIETFVTNDSECVTEYNSISAASASVFVSKQLVAGNISSSGSSTRCLLFAYDFVE